MDWCTVYNHECIWQMAEGHCLADCASGSMQGGAGRRMVQHHLPRPPGRSGRPPPRYPTRAPPRGDGMQPFQYRPQPPAYHLDAHAQPFTPHIQAWQVQMQQPPPGQQYTLPGTSYMVLQEQQQQPVAVHGTHWGAAVVAGPYTGQIQPGMQAPGYAAAPAVAPGYAGSLFASARPLPAQGPSGGRGPPTAARPWGRSTRDQRHGASYGGGYGQGRVGGPPGRHAQENRFTALRDPRSRR